MIILDGHDERVRGLAFSPDGTALASCGSDWTVRLWDLVEDRAPRIFRGHSRNVLGVVFGLDGRVLASAGNEASIRVWQAATGAVRSFVGPPSETSDAWLRALLGGRPPSKVPEASRRAVEAAGWRLLSNVRADVWTPDRALQRQVALARAARAGREPGKMHGEVITLEMEHRRFQVFIPATAHGTLRGTYVPGCGFSLGHSGDIEVAFAPDGRTLAVASGRFAHLGTLDEGRMTTLAGHEDLVWALAFAPDGGTLATGGHDGTVRLWDVATGRLRTGFDWQIGIVDSVAFAPDGLRIAAGGKAGIVIWDVDERA